MGPKMKFTIPNHIFLSPLDNHMRASTNYSAHHMSTIRWLKFYLLKAVGSKQCVVENGAPSSCLILEAARHTCLD